MNPQPQVVLTTFASRGFFGKQRLLCRSAVALGVVTRAIPVRHADLLASEFGKSHAALLKQPRGAGYWAWKPRVILDAMEECRDAEWVLYMDVGRWPRVLSRRLDPLIRWCEENDQDFLPGARVRDLGSSLRWTKRRCAEHFGFDEAEMNRFQQVNASWSLWRNTETSRAFLKEWSDLVTRTELVDDSPSPDPEWEGFEEHRHDQSILSCLVRREGVQALFDHGDDWVDQRTAKDLDSVLEHLGSPQVGSAARLRSFRVIQSLGSVWPWIRVQASTTRRRVSVGSTRAPANP